MKDVVFLEHRLQHFVVFIRVHFESYYFTQFHKSKVEFGIVGLELDLRKTHLLEMDFLEDKLLLFGEDEPLVC